MRHSRSKEFASALASFAPGHDPARQWRDDADDPNHPAALIRRAHVLRSAWRPAIRDRVLFLEARCSGKSVLDVGCVAHDILRMKSPQWLHGRLASVAERCLGVDVLNEGVEEMRRLGFDALVHDLSSGPGPVLDHAPFDVMIAGELIEHVESMDMLFRTAKLVLAPDGELVVTSPNPFAPDRVRAYQRGLVFENVDHILFAFPSGIAELAERHGLELCEAAVTRTSQSTSIVANLKSVRRRLRGTQWASVGYTTFSEIRIRRVSDGFFARLIRTMRSQQNRLLGETFVYVIRNPSNETSADGNATDLLVSP